jgi:hypothetical protein
MSNSNGRRIFEIRTITSSHFTASDNLLLGRWGVSSESPRVDRVNPLNNSRSWYPRSGPDPLEWTIPSPPEGNATAKQGYQRRAPLACSLLPSACTLTHAFASCPTRTQRIYLKHRSSIIAHHRMSPRWWSTPQSRATENSAKSRSTGVPIGCEVASPAGSKATFPQWPLSPFRRSAPLAPTISRVYRPIPTGEAASAISEGFGNRLAACPCHSRSKRRTARHARRASRRWGGSYAR